MMETRPPDRRKHERRLAQLEAARQRRWRGTTPEDRKAFAKKLSDAAKASRAGQARTKKIQTPRGSISVEAYDRICRYALKSRRSFKEAMCDVLERFRPDGDVVQSI